MPEIPLPSWIGLAVTWIQSFLNRWVPERWRPATLGAIATLAALYVVLTGPLTVQEFPWVVAAIFALATTAYTALKPLEAAKLSELKAAGAREAPGRIGTAVVGTLPVAAVGVLLGSPTVLLTLGAALLARLFERKKPSPPVGLGQAGFVDPWASSETRLLDGKSYKAGTTEGGGAGRR